jgi:hypothetical protein
MKKIAALCLSIAAAACGKDADPYRGPDTVDMSYVASVGWQSTTCGETDAEKVKTIVVDVLLRSDGKVNIAGLNDAPFPVTFYEVPIGPDGAVSYDKPLMDRDGNQYPQKIVGTLTSRKMELTVVSTDLSFTGSCARALKITGTPRLLGDRASADGKYRVSSPYYEQWCPDSPVEPDWDGTLTLDVAQLGDGKALLSLNDRSVFFIMPLKRAGGDVAWKGTLHVPFFFGGWGEADGLVKGRIGADTADLVIDMPSTFDADCAERMVATGPRRLPSAGSLDNDFAVRHEWTDSCTMETKSNEWAVETVTQSDGKVWLMEEGEITALNLAPDGTFSATFGSDPSRGIAVYAGKIAPPAIEYSIVIQRIDFSTGALCVTTVSANGRARYLGPTPGQALRLEDPAAGVASPTRSNWREPFNGSIRFDRASPRPSGRRTKLLHQQP